LSLYFDRIPEGYKQIVLTQLELRLADIKEQKQPGETDAQKSLKKKTLDHLTGVVKSLLTDGAELRLAFTIDRDANTTALESKLQAKPGSKLAKDLAALGAASSLFSTLVTKDAFSLATTLGLPEALKAALGPVVDELIQKALAEQADPNQRRLAEQVLKALAPTLKAGEFDFGVSLRGPDKKGLFTAVTGLKVKEGKALEQVLRDVATTLPEAEKARIKFDVARAGGHAVHRVDGTDHLDADARRLFGESPVYVGFRPDAVVLAIGPDAEAAVKEALTAQAGPAVLAKAEASLPRLAQANKPDDPTRKAAAEAFGTKTDIPLATLQLTGSSDGLTLRLSGPTLFLKWAVKIDAAKKATPAPDPKK
jgi:hypothetical protein